MSPHIASARRKLSWAQVRMDELESAIGLYKVEYGKSTTVKSNRESRMFTEVGDAVGTSSVDDDSPIPLIAGDVVGNLSAALDHAHRSIDDDRKSPSGERGVVAWPRGFPVPLRNEPGDKKWRQMIWNSVSHSQRWVEAAAIIERLYSNATEQNWAEHAAFKIRSIANGDKHAMTIGLRREHSFHPSIQQTRDKAVIAAFARYNRGMQTLMSGVPDAEAALDVRAALTELIAHDDVKLNETIEVFRNHPTTTPLSGEVREMIGFVAETIDAYEKVFGA